MNRIPIVIPAYKPDERMLLFCKQLRTHFDGEIIVVDDGSGADYLHFFNCAEQEFGCTILRHSQNFGKGRGLKTAFEYLLFAFGDDLLGCVTADCDGQHSVADILKCRKALEENDNSLVLGCRKFDPKQIPWKSYVGNTLTRAICKYLRRIDVSDTQTGLRAIPKDFMQELLSVAGDRFEFEINMLIEARERYPFVEVPIQTIYDSKENHQSHFNPFKDSIRICSVIFGSLSRFLISSFSSSIVDLVLFYLLCLFLSKENLIYVSIATVVARIVSSVYNYLINRWFVFHSKNKQSVTITKYFLLAAVILVASAVFTSCGVWLFPNLPEFVVKIAVDGGLFLASYYMQNRFIF